VLDESAGGLLLAHGPMQRAGFDIQLRPVDATVRPRDASRSDGSQTVASSRVAAAAPPHQPSRNLFDVLCRDDDGTEYDNARACNWTSADMQTAHEAWAHPGHSKFDSIITAYPHLFPKDKNYRASARKLRCPVCDLMKGARHYRKSKRMKIKAQRDHERRHKAAAGTSILRPPDTPEPHAAFAVAQDGAASVCAAHAKQKRVRFAPDTVDKHTLHADDFLRAFHTSVPLSRKSCFKAHHDLHIDYAHSISIGYKNEAYYLVMVVDGIDFLWATPTAHKSNPESLLESFLRHTNVKIGRIRMDDAGELSRSESFKMWCAARDIIICATAGYNHTMQARAEGAVRITKEHIRCLLKTANMPHMFWPWALTQFCRIFNYWPSHGHAPPWVMLDSHRFSQSIHRDLHPFGCYIIGQLPREHPLVSNTTLSDRGLEGAFLGWDLTTPTVWMWSFRLRKPIRLHDPIFYDSKYPFADPTCDRGG